MRKLTIIAALVACLSCASCTTADLPYVEMLKALRGTSYWTLQCSSYITAAHRSRHCGAAGFWNDGCGGELAVVAEANGFDGIDRSVLRDGDVISFHGVHVAAYVDGKFMDSDPN